MAVRRLPAFGGGATVLAGFTAWFAAFDQNGPGPAGNPEVVLWAAGAALVGFGTGLFFSQFLQGAPQQLAAPSADAKAGDGDAQALVADNGGTSVAVQESPGMISQQSKGGGPTIATSGPNSPVNYGTPLEVLPSGVKVEIIDVELISDLVLEVSFRLTPYPGQAPKVRDITIDAEGAPFPDRSANTWTSRFVDKEIEATASFEPGFSLINRCLRFKLTATSNMGRQSSDLFQVQLADPTDSTTT